MLAHGHMHGGAALQVINERDILGTQLIRRNDELALLYEKLKIQTSTLRKVSGGMYSHQPACMYLRKIPSIAQLDCFVS